MELKSPSLLKQTPQTNMERQQLISDSDLINNRVEESPGDLNLLDSFLNESEILRSKIDERSQNNIKQSSFADSLILTP